MLVPNSPFHSFRNRLGDEPSCFPYPCCERRNLK
jgi:hypothetical protein